MTTSTLDRLTQRRTVADRPRAIGPAGTAARILLGGYLVGTVIEAEITGGFTPLLWALGLLAFPGVLLAAQWTRARRGAGQLHATGPVAHLVTLAGFMALTLVPEYNRAIDVTGDAAVIFVGTSMLLAAARGYAGCEVLAISNWAAAPRRPARLHRLRPRRSRRVAAAALPMTTLSRALDFCYEPER